MNERQAKLLDLVIENHIETAEPVGSRFLVSEGDVSWGEATIRNELRALEESGYLTHPHTSAGRIPTAKGYRHFVNNIDFSKAKITKKEKDFLEQSAKDKEKELAGKNLAKALADITKETILVAFNLNKVYYTGISNLFSKPEIIELNLVADVSAMFDRCEDCLEEFYNEVDEEPKYFIGEEHPFGNLLSAVAVRFGKDGMLTILGPQRMNYKKNMAVLYEAKNILK